MKKIFSAIGIFLQLFLIFTSGIATQITMAEEMPNDGEMKLLITEVNFKNKEHDWIEIYYESPTKQQLNLKNYQFQDDKIFKTVTQNYFLLSGQYYVLKFKSSEIDDENNRALTTTRSGLTATTEQVILKNPDSKIIDAVCWSNKKATADEKKDMEDLFKENQWNSSTAESCIDSEKVGTNQSIIRTNFIDTQSDKDWITTSVATPGEPNKKVTATPAKKVMTSTSTSTIPQTSTKTTLTVETKSPAATNSTSTAKNIGENTSSTPNIQGTKTQVVESPAPSEKNDFSTLPKTSTGDIILEDATTPEVPQIKATLPKVEKPSQKVTAQSSTKSKKTYKSGDLSDKIIISEIFPHAEKDDRANEWVELFNKGETPVKLGNWQLDDQEGGSKPYTLPDTLTLEPQKAILIKAPDSKLSFSNTKDEVRLFDPKGNILETVRFDEAPKGQSYGLTMIHKEDGSIEQKWLWGNKPTPGAQNPDYFEYTGTIVAPMDFSTPYSFQLKTSDNTIHTIIFDEGLIAGPLAQSTFREGITITIQGVPESGNPLLLNLKKYEVTQTQEYQTKTDAWMTGIVVMAVSLFFSIAIWMIRKKMIKQEGNMKQP